MSIAARARNAAALADPLASAIRMNVAGAVRTRRRGLRGWTGAVNTDYDPLDPATAAQPHEAYRALHNGGRVHYNPRRATWILHRLEDVRTALRDTDYVTSSQGVTRMRIAADLVVVTDGEQHSRLRKQVQPAFTKRALDSWHSIVDKLAVELVDTMIANPGGDAVQLLTIPMPLRVIAAILGVPDSDVADFRRWSERSVQVIDFAPTPKGMLKVAKSLSGAIALRRYFLEQLSAGHLKESDTVLGRLIEHSAEGSLTDDQLFLIAILLLIAGNETTTNLLGGMLDTLANDPALFDRLRAEPELIPMAIEEQLRFTTPIQNLYRYTRADYRVGSVTIPKGERVLLSFGAANRDPLVFDDPDTYRVERNPRTHVAFGYGAHMCLGAPLARLEAHAVLRELINRVSQITPTAAATWSTNSSLRGPTVLPLTLKAATSK